MAGQGVAQAVIGILALWYSSSSGGSICSLFGCCWRRRLRDWMGSGRGGRVGLLLLVVVQTRAFVGAKWFCTRVRRSRVIQFRVQAHLRRLTSSSRVIQKGKKQLAPFAPTQFMSSPSPKQLAQQLQAYSHDPTTPDALTELLQPARLALRNGLAFRSAWLLQLVTPNLTLLTVQSCMRQLNRALESSR